VTVFVDSDTKWIPSHVSAVKGTVHLELNGRQIASSTGISTHAKKRAAWVQDKTGSHLSGHWDDEAYQGPKIDGVASLGTEEFSRFQRHLGGQH
jgi:hypothetical protein